MLHPCFRRCRRGPLRLRLVTIVPLDCPALVQLKMPKAVHPLNLTASTVVVSSSTISPPVVLLLSQCIVWPSTVSSMPVPPWPSNGTGNSLFSGSNVGMPSGRGAGGRKRRQRKHGDDAQAECLQSAIHLASTPLVAVFAGGGLRIRSRRPAPTPSYSLARATLPVPQSTLPGPPSPVNDSAPMFSISAATIAAAECSAGAGRSPRPCASPARRQAAGLSLFSLTSAFARVDPDRFVGCQRRRPFDRRLLVFKSTEAGGFRCQRRLLCFAIFCTPVRDAGMLNAFCLAERQCEFFAEFIHGRDVAQHRAFDRHCCGEARELGEFVAALRMQQDACFVLVCAGVDEVPFDWVRSRSCRSTVPRSCS